MDVIKTSEKLVNSILLGKHNKPLVQRVEEPSFDKDVIKELFKNELEEAFESAKNSGLDSGMKTADELIQEELTKSKNLLTVEFEKKESELEKEYQEKHLRITEALKGIELVHNKLQTRIDDQNKELEFNTIELTTQCLFKVAGQKNFLGKLLEASIIAELAKVDADTQTVITVSPEAYSLIKEFNVLGEPDTIFKQDFDMSNSVFTIEYDHTLNTVDLIKRIESSCLTLIKCYENRNI